jgi:hypothetical protein
MILPTLNLAQPADPIRTRPIIPETLAPVLSPQSGYPPLPTPPERSSYWNPGLYSGCMEDYTFNTALIVSDHVHDPPRHKLLIPRAHYTPGATFLPPNGLRISLTVRPSQDELQDELQDLFTRLHTMAMRHMMD